ncbi:MAG: sensor histidine kinase [Candidatus Dormibacter sp.]
MTRGTLLALSIAGIGAALLGSGLILLLVDPISIDPGDRPWLIAQVCFALGYGTFGAFLAARRPGNSIGWLCLATGLASAALVFSEEYAIRGIVVAPGSLPAGLAVTMVLPGLAALVWPSFIYMIVAVYPTGRPSARRWWSAIWAAAAFGLLFALSNLLAPGPLSAPIRQSVALHLSNPFGTPLGATVTNLRNSPLVLLPFVLAVAAVVDRWRRARGEERQQLKWLAAVGLLLVLVFVAFGTFDVAQVSHPDWLGALIALVMLLGFTFGIPGAIVVAILRYRLYEIDVVLNRTLVYGALAVFITVVYVGIVVGIGSLIGSRGQPNLALSIVATAVVAVAFQPVRERVERIANRLVYGQRATPYEVLTQFSHRVAAAVANEEVLPRLARVLVEGTGSTAASVWMRRDGAAIAAATWPHNLPPVSSAEADRAVRVRHQGEDLGELTLKKRPGEPFSPVEEKLVGDIAAQAGQVLRNVRLTAELQARLREISAQAVELRESRQRIVAAQDAERRRLERNIHDGAQQHLVALAVKLRLTATLAKKDTKRAIPSIDELRRQTRDALETLGALAAGLYPPVLRDRGIAAALAAQTASSAMPIQVVSDVAGRYPEELEAAVYFCCQEAIQNAIKHANTGRVRVRLAERGDALSFEVTDDGAGFDPSTATQGVGMQNMADRIAAAGGSLTIESVPGSGTTVRGRVPTRATMLS